MSCRQGQKGEHSQWDAWCLRGFKVPACSCRSEIVSLKGQRGLQQVSLNPHLHAPQQPEPLGALNLRVVAGQPRCSELFPHQILCA
jgi:hypothetical protein